MTSDAFAASTSAPRAPSAYSQSLRRSYPRRRPYAGELRPLPLRSTCSADGEPTAAAIFFPHRKQPPPRPPATPRMTAIEEIPEQSFAPINSSAHTSTRKLIHGPHSPHQRPASAPANANSLARPRRKLYPPRDRCSNHRLRVSQHPSPSLPKKRWFAHQRTVLSINQATSGDLHERLPPPTRSQRHALSYIGPRPANPTSATTFKPASTAASRWPCLRRLARDHAIQTATIPHPASASAPNSSAATALPRRNITTAQIFALIISITNRNPPLSANQPLRLACALHPQRPAH